MKLMLMRLAAVGVALTVGCSSPAGQGTPPGAVRGELVTYVLDRDDGTSERQHFLRVGASGEERRLLFERAVDLQPGVTLDVWGTARAGAFEVSRIVACRSWMLTRSTI